MSREVEVLRNNCWCPAEFSDLVKGDVIRIYEDSGKPVLTNEGFHTMIVARKMRRSIEGTEEIFVWGDV